MNTKDQSDFTREIRKSRSCRTRRHGTEVNIHGHGGILAATARALTLAGAHRRPKVLLSRRIRQDPQTKGGSDPIVLVQFVAHGAGADLVVYAEREAVRALTRLALYKQAFPGTVSDLADLAGLGGKAGETIWACRRCLVQYLLWHGHWIWRRHIGAFCGHTVRWPNAKHRTCQRVRRCANKLYCIKIWRCMVEKRRNKYLEYRFFSETTLEVGKWGQSRVQFIMTDVTQRHIKATWCRL